MSSKIEQTIEEIERYIESCPRHTLSKSKIIVNKEEFMELLSELRLKTPEEIKKCQKMVSNQEKILAKAKSTADDMIEKAKLQIVELVNEHQIVQQAYIQANEIVKNARVESDEILQHANEEARIIRESAIQYTDDLLKSAEDVIVGAIETTKARSDKLLASLGHSYETIQANRNELFPQDSSESDKKVSEEQGDLPDINLMN